MVCLQINDLGLEVSVMNLAGYCQGYSNSISYEVRNGVDELQYLIQWSRFDNKIILCPKEL